MTVNDMRLIDADKLERHEADTYGAVEDVVYAEDIDNAPTIDAVPVRHGKWVWDERFADYTCSECHNWDLKTPNFCSNCGADMRGEKNG